MSFEGNYVKSTREINFTEKSCNVLVSLIVMNHNSMQHFSPASLKFLTIQISPIFNGCQHFQTIHFLQIGSLVLAFFLEFRQNGS